ncbi:MAG: enolase C-terminal domain-like protein [candidate division KSB1 bacterium]|nr:enolase C-terminal domain-like protein [candidate division KSB1 bacterium]
MISNLDQQVVEQVRKVMGPDAFILGDVNRGYTSFDSLDDLAVILRSLYDHGLDACEDPAELINRQWVELQEKVDGLALVPDRPTRTSWLALESLIPDMGRYYNMHPAGLGSIRHMIQVTEQIKQWGHGIMIGDASLIGPGCSAWQQIAIGVGASWVEAIEKPQESEVFLKAIISKSTFQKHGLITMQPKPGFGLEVDDQFLRKMADDYCSL